MFRTFARIAKSLTLAGIGSLLVCSGANRAQAQSPVIYVADIPFAFQMNDSLFPAGKYQITQDSPYNLRLRQIGGKHAGYAGVYPGDDARSEDAQIRFTRYGERTFLRDFTTAATGVGRRSVSRCHVSPAEKRAAHDWVQTKQTFTTVALNVYPQH